MAQRVQYIRHSFASSAWCSGVEVYDREWSYGGGVNGPSGSGVFCCRPRGNALACYTEIAWHPGYGFE